MSFLAECDNGSRIAIAPANDPELIITDEPTTALDANLCRLGFCIFLSVWRERGLALLFISHDMNVVAQISDKFAQYTGRSSKLDQQKRCWKTQTPLHKTLLDCLPQLGSQAMPRASAMTPLLKDLPDGCALYQDVVCTPACQRGQLRLKFD